MSESDNERSGAGVVGTVGGLGVGGAMLMKVAVGAEHVAPIAAREAVAVTAVSRVATATEHSGGAFRVASEVAEETSGLGRTRFGSVAGAQAAEDLSHTANNRSLRVFVAEGHTENAGVQRALEHLETVNDLSDLPVGDFLSWAAEDEDGFEESAQEAPVVRPGLGTAHYGVVRRDGHPASALVFTELGTWQETPALARTERLNNEQSVFFFVEQTLYEQRVRNARVPRLAVTMLSIEPRHSWTEQMMQGSLRVPQVLVTPDGRRYYRVDRRPSTTHSIQVEDPVIVRIDGAVTSQR